MTIRMLINATAPNELRIAIVEDGELTELDIEASETSTLKGNVYKGVVHNVEGSLEAAFVDIGRHKQGFLPFSEVSPSQYARPWTGKGKPKITDVLKRGQEIIVQVAKDAIGEKGATLTTYLSMPGRYTVLMPDSDANGISRKIDDEKVRRRIRSVAQKIERPEGCGFIVRTAGFSQTRIALQKDLERLVSTWKKIQKATEIARAPSIIHSEPDLVGRTLRDFFSDEIDEVLIDSKDEYEAAVEYFREVMPVYVDRLQHYQNPIPIFAYHHVEEQIESTFERRVPLPSGGSLVIDETEALVAIDVNSGKNTSEGDHEQTVFKTNCEAAEEAARQLKLRDLGGIVVVDFIDMEETKHKREVERVFEEVSKEDKARYKISRINSKGICVLTRQRIRQGMRKAYQHRCPVCTGTGWLRTPESHALSLLRRIETRLAQGGVGEARVLTHKDTAEHILNVKRKELLDLEKRFGCRVIIMARAEMDRGKDEVTYLSNAEVLSEITDKLPPREERRNRGGKRKRKKRKKAELPPVEEEELEAASEEEEPAAEPRKRRRRRRGRGPSEGTEAPAEVAAEAPEPIAAKPTGLKPKGSTTFTGRPTPEMIERAKAERRARQARRNGDVETAERILAELEASFGKPEAAPEPEPASEPEVAAPEPVEAPVEAASEVASEAWAEDTEVEIAEPETEPAKEDAEPEMDVVGAFAIAEAILGAKGGLEAEALLEAAQLARTAPTPSETAPGEPTDAEPTRVDSEVPDPESPAEPEAATAETAEASEVGEASEADEESGESEDGVDAAQEGDAPSKRRKRRRRRRGRRRKDEGETADAEASSEAEPVPVAVVAEVEVVETEETEDQPSEAPAAVRAVLTAAVDPEAVAARKALLHRIFTSR